MKKAIIKKYTLILLVFTFYVNVNAQTQFSFPHVATVTPEAAAIAQYQDMPVSLYSGTPEISIPLYEIDVDGFKIPITMKYHASGIKVAQEASWVGLGWTLEVGGRISRSVKDADDLLGNYNYDGNDPRHPFYRKGYYYAPEIEYVNDPGCSHPNTHEMANNPYDPNVVQGLIMGSLWLEQVYDSEPDIFYYNIPSYSGKFYLDKSRGAVLMDKSHNITITPYKIGYQTTHLHAKDAEGNKYYFRDEEKTRSYYQRTFLNKNGTQGTGLDDDGEDYTEWVFRGWDDGLGFDPDPAPFTPYNLTSSWCLSEIVTRTNRHVFFHYVDEEQKLPTQESYEIFNGLDDHTGRPNGTKLDYYYKSKHVHSSKRLSRIDFDYGYITFASSDRYDIKGSSKRLDRISVFSTDGSLIKTIDFDYGYFNPEYIDDEYENVFLRLKLNAVHDSSMENPYTFTYNEQHTLPAKNSKSTDYWGYYNGRSYGAQYPVGVYYNSYEFDGYRKDANLEYAITGTISKITYPTGGYHKFTFGSNDFPTHFAYLTNDEMAEAPNGNPNANAVVMIDTYNPTYIAFNDYMGYPTDSTYIFTLYGTTSVKIVCTLENLSGVRDASFNYNTSFGVLSMLSPENNTLATLYGEFPLLFDEAPGVGSEITMVEKQYTLEAGTYSIHVGAMPAEVHSTWRIKLDPRYPTPSGHNEIQQGNFPSREQGGEIRIKLIESPSTRKSYSYYGGALLTSPVLYYVTKKNIGDHFSNFLVQVSESMTPMSTFCSGHEVGYDRVVETILGDADNPTSVIYYYRNVPETDLVDDNLFEGPIEPVYTNGLLVKKEVYSDDVVLVKKNEYEYSSFYSNSIHAIFDRSNHLYTGDHTGYNIQVEWPMLQCDTETLIDNYGNEKITSKTFAYNDNGLVQSVTTHSGGETFKEKFAYPPDFASSDSIYRSMADSNMVSLLAENLKMRNDKVWQAEKLTYTTFNGMFLVNYRYGMESIVAMNENSYQSQYKQHEAYTYYSHGNVRSQADSDGNLIVFLWGYNGEYPVAVIEGATYSEVSQHLPASLINNIQATINDAQMIAYLNQVRSCLDGSGFLVTTYTYLPLVGMTSKTTPNGITTYYVYDSRKRLSAIKDSSGSVLQQFYYHYANPN